MCVNFQSYKFSKNACFRKKTAYFYPGRTLNGKYIDLLIWRYSYYSFRDHMIIIVIIYYYYSNTAAAEQQVYFVSQRFRLIKILRFLIVYKIFH